MNLSRRDFLKTTLEGGIGLLLGGASIQKLFWREKGTRLTSVTRSSLVMGSVISFEVIVENEQDGYEAIRRGLDVFRDLDRKLSMYDSGSEMGRLSQNAGIKEIALSKDALRVLRFAKQVFRETEEHFDVTIEPAMKQWGFRESPDREVEPPSDRELRILERIIGSEKLQIEGTKAFLKEKGMAVDLGGIAGGYALDKAVKEMKRADVAAAFINFSGDIHCFGKPLDGEGWPVYLLDPYSQEPLDHSIILQDKALSTSGAYQNRRKASKDHSWGHLFLPESVAPVDSRGSITAIHTSAMTADAWSTAAFVGSKRPTNIQWIRL